MSRFYQRTHTWFKYRRMASHILCALLLSLISACDGGIFGTGGGEDPDQTTIPGMSTGVDGAAPTETPTGNDVQPGSTDGATTDGATTSGSTTDGQVPGPDASVDSSLTTFNNTQSVTGRNDALIRLVNAHLELNDSIIATVNKQQSDPLLPLPGLDFIQGSSNYLSINATESTSIEILAAEDFRASLFNDAIALEPLELAPGSLSTLVVRASRGPEADNFEILPLSTRSTAADNLASLRVVHAAKSYSTEDTINVFLLPFGGTRDQAIAGFIPLDYANQPETAYVDVEPGQYVLELGIAELTIGLSSNINPINLVAGETVTLIIRDTQTGTPGMDADIILLQDSQLP